MAAGGELYPHVHIPVAAPVNIKIGLDLSIILCNVQPLHSVCVYEEE